MKPDLGKFEGCDDGRLAEVLYGMDTDDDVGSVQDLGWYGLILHRSHAYLVNEDPQGFFTYEHFETAAAARAEFDVITESYEEFDDAEGEEVEA